MYAYICRDHTNSKHPVYLYQQQKNMHDAVARLASSSWGSGAESVPGKINKLFFFAEKANGRPPNRLRKTNNENKNNIITSTDSCFAGCMHAAHHSSPRPIQHAAVVLLVRSITYVNVSTLATRTANRAAASNPREERLQHQKITIN